MPKVTILHYSDAHWHPENRKNLSTVIKAMVADIEYLKESRSLKFDLVGFTGDLVLAGENSSHFGMADTEIIEPILNVSGVSRNEFFICPGNHDISRKQARDDEIIEAGLKAKLSSADAVNSFIEKLVNGDMSAKLAMSRTANFLNYSSGNQAKPVTEFGTVKVFKAVANGAVVGIASFDNSWRASGEHAGDRQGLLMGERNVDFAIDQMANVDLAIAMFHHPLTWLADFESAAVGPRLQKGFDLLIFGHMHTSEPEIRKTVSGTAVLCQSGSVYAGRNYFNGYQILEVDTDVCQVRMLLRSYFDGPTPHFSSAENIVIGGEVTLDYAQSRGKTDPEIEKYLRAVRPSVRQLALDQFNISDIGAEICVDPHTAFICPPIFLKQDGAIDNSDNQLENAEGGGDPEVHGVRQKGMEVSIDNLLDRKENFLITGGREIGKTSLAHFIAVKVADGECDKPRIPLIIDYRTFGGNLYSIKRQAAGYLGVHGTGIDIEKALNAGNVLLILDNYSGQNSTAKANLQKLASSYPETRWILLADARMGGTNRAVDGNDLINGFVVAKIETLPRKSIRELTRRWCERTGADKEKTFSTVMGHINSSDLPRTGYIVTLLLWAIRQGDKLERINEAVLIMNMVDYLLGKADFQQALEKEFDATSKEITLQSFAKFIREQGDVTSPNEAISFLIGFFRDRGLDYDASGVLEVLCKCGILVKREGHVSFKYRCFQEYFIAKHLDSSDERLKEVIFDRSYLGYQREIEILSGLKRENKFILDELSFQLKNYQPDFIANVDMSAFDYIVDEESSVIISRRKLRQIRQKKLTSDQIDDLMDAAEAEISQRRKPSKKGGASTRKEDASSDSASISDSPSSKNDLPGTVLIQPKLSAASYMITLSLLGKVIRNSEFADREKKIEVVRLYVALSAKLFVFFNSVVLDVFQSMVGTMNKDTDFLDSESIRALKYFLTKRMMLFSDSMVCGDIGGTKLIPIFEDILRANNISLAEKMFLSGIQLDIGNASWAAHWGRLAEDSKKRRITIEFLVDKLWSHVHEKVLSASERREVEKMSAELEVALGADKRSKGDIMRHMRAVAEKQVRKHERDE